MHNKKIILLKAKSDGALIQNFTYEDLETAYQMAANLETAGIDVELLIPGAVESLANELGLSVPQQQMLAESVEEELDDHDH